METSSFPEMYSQSQRVQPEDCGNTFQVNLRVPMLQLLCNTSKADSLNAKMSTDTVSFICDWILENLPFWHIIKADTVLSSISCRIKKLWV